MRHILISEEELQHHGIKGQKWGVRRFQNKDGSLTNDGKRRYSDDVYKNAKKSIDAIHETVKSGKTVSNELGKVAQKEFDKKYQKEIRKSLDEMTDDELRAVVNRLNMEERYTQVMTSRAPKLGKNKVDEILDYAGTVLSISSSALAIALAIKQMK